MLLRYTLRASRLRSSIHPTYWPFVGKRTAHLQSRATGMVATEALVAAVAAIAMVAAIATIVVILTMAVSGSGNGGGVKGGHECRNGGDGDVDGIKDGSGGDGSGGDGGGDGGGNGGSQDNGGSGSGGYTPYSHEKVSK